MPSIVLLMLNPYFKSLILEAENNIFKSYARVRAFVPNADNQRALPKKEIP
jgi:hypothetical protein